MMKWRGIQTDRAKMILEGNVYIILCCVFYILLHYDITCIPSTSVRNADFF